MIDSAPVSTGNAVRKADIPASREHKPELDGVRGLAILCVLIVHCTSVFPVFGPQAMDSIWFRPIHVLWGGVDLFFALSGFLITGILLDSRSSPNYFQSFYARRILRIFPLYYGLVLSCIALASIFHFGNNLFPSLLADRVKYLLYLQNVPPIHFSGILGHFWSLAVEEQFYLIWPLVVWKCSRKTILWICGIGLVVSFCYREHQIHAHGPILINLILTISRLDGLLIGAALAITMRTKQLQASWITISALTGGAIVAFFLIVRPDDSRSIGPLMQLFSVPAFALLSGALIAATQKPGRLQLLFRTRWLRSFGKYSYGIYVYHDPVLILLGRKLHGFFPLPFFVAVLYSCLIIAVSFGIAWISYTYLESRFLKLKRFFPAFGQEGEGQSAEINRGALPLGASAA